MFVDYDNWVSEEVAEETVRRVVPFLRSKAKWEMALGLLFTFIDMHPDSVNTKLKNELGLTYQLMGRTDLAKDVFFEVLEGNPTNSYANIQLGEFFFEEKNFSMASTYLRQGLKSDDLNIQGRKDKDRLYLTWGDSLRRNGRLAEAKVVYQEAVDLGHLLSAEQRALIFYPLQSKPVWKFGETGYEDYFKVLLKNWKIIRDEALGLLSDQYKQDFLAESVTRRITSLGEWRQMIFMEEGKVNETNCQKAPKTCEIVSQFGPARECTYCQTKFSVMWPNTTVFPHCAPNNLRLRAHLGLNVPEEGPLGLRIGNDTLRWENGKLLLIDDSYEHEVWHHGKEPRTILIVDFWHPNLPESQRAQLLGRKA